MYKVRSNDGDIWSCEDIDDVLQLLGNLLRADCREEETKENNSYEINYKED